MSARSRARTAAAQAVTSARNCLELAAIDRQHFGPTEDRRLTRLLDDAERLKEQLEGFDYGHGKGSAR